MLTHSLVSRCFPWCPDVLERVVRCGTEGVVVPVLNQYQHGLMYISTSVKQVSDGFGGSVCFCFGRHKLSERLFDVLYGLCCCCVCRSCRKHESAEC